MSDVLTPRLLKPLTQRAQAKMSLRGELTVLASSVFVVGSFFWFPFCVYYTYKKLATTRARKLFLLAVLLYLTFAPVREWPGIRHNYLWTQWVKYFSPQVIFEAPLPQTDKPIMFAMSPHGIYPFGQAIALVGDLSQKFRNMRPIVADAALRFPVFRQLLGWVGAVGASKKSIATALQQKQNLCIVPGGIAEMYVSNSKRATVLLESRKGFIKQALEHNAHLVPVYIFGNNKLLKLVPGMKYLQWLSRQLQMSLVLFFGRFGLPIPFRRPLLYAVGAPVPLPHIPTGTQPTQVQVDTAHRAFVTAMRGLAARYASSYSTRTVPLDVR